MAAAAILKIKKSRYLSDGLTDLHEIWLMMQNGSLDRTPQKIESQKSKMASAAILKTVISPYLRIRLTDFDEIRHADAVPVSSPHRLKKCRNLKLKTVDVKP